jgi:hypothetical protein
MQFASVPEPLVSGVRGMSVRSDLKIRRPDAPVSKRISFIVLQFEVPGEQTVTLTHGLLG